MIQFAAVLVLMLMPFALAAQETENAEMPVAAAYGDDLLILRAILDECGLGSVSAESVSKIDSGRVVELDLANKDISKSGISVLPARIGELRFLRKLVLTDNVLDSIPVEIGYLRSLTELNIGSNRLETVPHSITNLVSLERLDLRYNSLTALPAGISGMRRLAYLQLWGNKFVTLPDEIAKLPSLRELYLKDNRLTTLPIGLTTMKTLTYIDFLNNRLCKLKPALDAWVKSKDKLYGGTQKCW